MAHLDRITIEPGKRSGKPCIRGLRMTVSDVLDYLASGMSEEDLLRDFPGPDARRHPGLPRVRRGSRAATGCGPRTVKLLLDQNLSPRLCDCLHDIWTDVAHVRAVGLAAADDSAVWAYARQHGFTIVSKDGDFSGRSSLIVPVRCAAEGHLAGARQLLDQRD